MRQLSSIGTSIFRNPLLIWLASPIPFIITGTLGGWSYNSFQFYPFLLFYSFLLCTVLIERYFVRQKERNLSILSPFTSFLLVSIVVLLFLFSIAVNIFATLLLVLYVGFLVVTFVQRIQLESSVFFPLVQLFFQAIILNQVAFYTQAAFLPFQFLFFYLPVACFLLLPILYRQRSIAQSQQVEDSYQHILTKRFLPLLGGTYLVAIGLASYVLDSQSVPFTAILLFIGVQILYLVPLLLPALRKLIHTKTYLSLLASLSIIVYSILLAFPF